jgi:hypothetical protein
MCRYVSRPYKSPVLPGMVYSTTSSSSGAATHLHTDIYKYTKDAQYYVRVTAC